MRLSGIHWRAWALVGLAVGALPIVPYALAYRSAILGLPHPNTPGFDLTDLAYLPAVPTYALLWHLGYEVWAGSTDHTLNQLAVRWLAHIGVTIVFWTILAIGLGWAVQRLSAQLPRRGS